MSTYKRKACKVRYIFFFFFFIHKHAYCTRGCIKFIREITKQTEVSIKKLILNKI